MTFCYGACQLATLLCNVCVCVEEERVEVLDAAFKRWKGEGEVTGRISPTVKM